ncbi:MAG: M23 family metallopeptidase [Promethearchaeota archaeon]
MNRKICAIGFVVVLIIAVGVVFLLGMEQPEEAPFDNEGRYDSTILDSMGVIYGNQSDIAHWNDGYSESDACPWGFAHNGLDYMFHNNSPVIAAAPGLVIGIEIDYLPNSTVYKVGVHIQFNESIWLEYGFEGNANETLRAQQVAMLYVEVGDWVSKGDQIARFLRPIEFDHVHFGVYLNDEAICPRLVMGESDYNEIISLIHSFHPTWELCYP